MHKELEQADAADIQDWFAARHASSKATTANRRLAALRRYYLWALRQGLVHSDPCLTLRAAKQAARFPKSLRSEEHTSELQSLMRTSYAVFCLKKKTDHKNKKTRIKPRK